MKIRFEFLDGLRGLSSLWVLLFHSLLFNGYNIEGKHAIKWSDNLLLFILQKPLSIGYLAVPIFIVLSGFCLALPVINNDLILKGGFKRYITRRAKRLIPPYYIALFFSLALIFCFPILQELKSTAWDSKLPITNGSIASHLFLMHNFNPNWIYKINGAHWSIATEWQIYWLFPLMLILWKKTNWIISFIIFAIISLVLHKYIHFTAPEFIILFFFGVICSYFSIKAKRFQKINLISSTTIVGITFITFMLREYEKLHMNIIVGLVISYFIYSLTTYKRFNSNKIIFLENKKVEFLGKISYSMYLIHGPILAIFNLFLLKYLNITDDLRQLIIFLFCTIIIIPVSTLFYNFIERKFLNK
ncbi:acyltransferase [Empedobacter falsenii]